MNNLHFHRYHCYNKDGKKIGKRVEIGQTPVDLPDHTPWVRGTGPFSPEAREAVTKANRAAFCGVPKTAEQKEKMRQAKLGVPKSAKHREAMCAAQQRRWYGES